MFAVAWYKRAVYQFVQSRGREVGSNAVGGPGRGGLGASSRQ
jgi:hypothetical protein